MRDPNKSDRSRRHQGVILLLLIGCFLTGLHVSARQPGSSKLRPLPARLKGITLVDMQRYPDLSKAKALEYSERVAVIREALKHHRHNPGDAGQRLTARVVFDLVDDKVKNDVAHRSNYLNARNYREILTELHGTSFVMGEIADSYKSLKNCDLDCYTQRTTHFLDELGDLVDLWEVGNEVNGDWTGVPEEVAEKIRNSAKLVKARDARTVLTLYYNQPCVKKNAKDEMFTWLRDNDLSQVPLDYVLVSYYEDDCHSDLLRRVPAETWVAVFQQLAIMFPKAQVGFGEIGTKDKKRKSEQISWYYDTLDKRLRTEPALLGRYAGGYFWWHYRNDMVPWTSPFWTNLDNALLTWK